MRNDNPVQSSNRSDQSVQGDTSQKNTSFPIGSALMIIVSLWTLGVVGIVKLFDLAGGRGPVQYAAGDSQAMFVFNIRVVTTLAMFTVPLVAGVIGRLRLAHGYRSKSTWLLIGACCYVVVLVVLFRTRFIPTV